jgi:hypothetical protein
VRNLVQHSIRVRLQPRHLGKGTHPCQVTRAASEHVEADLRCDAVEPGTKQ